MSQYDLMLYLKIKTVSLWHVFHGSVILPYILKAIWCINMILWANESVWLDAWPQNKSWSLWPIFHGSVILAYIWKTIWCIRRWHWPGVYVSPCSLALFRISFCVLAENWNHLKDTLLFLVILIWKNLNRVLLTSDLLPNISLVVGQLSVNVSLPLRARDISTSGLTSNQWYIGQRVPVSKTLFLRKQLYAMKS